MLQHFYDDYLAAAGFFLNDREGLFEIRLSGRTIGRLREKFRIYRCKKTTCIHASKTCAQGVHTPSCAT